MLLVKKSKMTKKQLAANRENQKLCNAPVTGERRERVRAALRRFGYNVSRTQDANMREVRRLINLLLRIKRYERQMEALEKTAALHDVLEKKGVSCLEQKCLKASTHSGSEI